MKELQHELGAFPALAVLALLVMVSLPAISFGDNGYGDRRYGGGSVRLPQIRDAIEIRVNGDDIVAFLAGAPPQQIELSPGETVRSVQTGRQVGAVVTSDRMLAISTETLEWHSLSLEPGETVAGNNAAAYIALVVTSERGVVFDPALDRFEEFDIPLGEDIIDRVVLADVAVFATSDRTVGYRSAAGDFREVSFSTGELFRGLKILAAGLVSVVTSDRALLFQGSSPEGMQWTEYEETVEEGEVEYFRSPGF